MFPEVNKVFEFFLKNPTKTVYIRELSRLINMSPAGCLKALRKLEEKGTIEQEKTKALVSYKVKRTEKFVQLKMAYNVYSLFSSGMVDFLKQKYEFPNSIIVFGSYAKGEDTEKSDIDIAVVTKLEKSLNLKIFETVLERKINILELENIKKLKKEFLANLANGIVLDGVMQL